MRIMSILIKVLIGVAVAWVLVTMGLYLGQRRMMYVPDRTRVDPGSIGLRNVEEVVLTAPDGARLIAWWGKAKPGQPTILYFHGNGAGLADRAPRIERYMGEGWGVFMMSYRGYSGSTGSPTEADNVADAMRTFDHLVAAGVRPQDIIIYGESLGTGVATQVAAERQARGLVLDAPYTSIAAVASRRFPILPVDRFILDRYDTHKVIGRVRMPVLIMHGRRDGVIPVEMGREIARLANEPKRYVELPNGQHSDLYTDGNDAMRHLKAWVAGP